MEEGRKKCNQTVLQNHWLDKVYLKTHFRKAPSVARQMWTGSSYLTSVMSPERKIHAKHFHVNKLFSGLFIELFYCLTTKAESLRHEALINVTSEKSKVFTWVLRQRLGIWEFKCSCVPTSFYMCSFKYEKTSLGARLWVQGGQEFPLFCLKKSFYRHIGKLFSQHSFNIITNNPDVSGIKYKIHSHVDDQFVLLSHHLKQ